MYVVRQSEQHFIDVLYTDIIVNPNLLVFPLLSPPPPPPTPPRPCWFSLNNSTKTKGVNLAYCSIWEDFIRYWYP